MNRKRKTVQPTHSIVHESPLPPVIRSIERVIKTAFLHGVPSLIQYYECSPTVDSEYNGFIVTLHGQLVVCNKYCVELERYHKNCYAMGCRIVGQDTKEQNWLVGRTVQTRVADQGTTRIRFGMSDHILGLLVMPVFLNQGTHKQTVGIVEVVTLVPKASYDEDFFQIHNLLKNEGLESEGMAKMIKVEFKDDMIKFPLSSVITPELQYTILVNGTSRARFENWQKGHILGSGSFGTVNEGLDESGCFFAVKEVSLLDQGSQGNPSKVQLEQEISLLRQFHHENIVRYLGTDSDDGKLYIFLELVTKGSLRKLYQEYELQDSQVSAYTRQILSGLNYLHERNVVHRDIKCANILVEVSGSVKLADFGLAKVTTLNDIKSCKGTAYFMAPEVVNNQSKEGYGLAVDVWSLGCTVLEMLTRKIPYDGLEWFQAAYKIGSGERPEIPNTLSAEAKDFILKCLQVNPNDRPTAAQLLEHPFLRRPTSMNSALPSPSHNSPKL